MDLTIGSERLVGAVGDVYGERSISATIGKLKGKRMVGPWIRCLAWSAQHPEQEVAVQLVLGYRREGEVQVEAHEFGLWDRSQGDRERYAVARLAELIQLYRRGMDRPLPLFVRSSQAFAETIDGALTAADFEQDGPADLDSDPAPKLRTATEAARKKWDPPAFQRGGPGEGEDPHLAQVFGHEHPIVCQEGEGAGQVQPEFAKLALLFWQPVLEARRKISEGVEEVDR